VVRVEKINKKPLLVLTPGDPDGIGPELVWKIISQPQPIEKSVSLLCVGAQEPFRRMGVPVVLSSPFLSGAPPPRQKKPFIWLIPAPSVANKNTFLPGFQAGWSIKMATRLVLNQRASALITGPISKERLQRGGFPFSGHTEFLADLCHTPLVTMMLTNQHLSISLVTTHLPLQAVSRFLTRKRIRITVQNTLAYLKKYRKIKTPVIKVAALNPHAGEGGLFGKEEIKIIAPEIASLQRLNQKNHRRNRFKISGPFPADTLFVKHLLEAPAQKADAIICMYHDQGLIPVKLLDFPKTVNVTLGLPFIRTSVDHGVGFDLVGKGCADPSSLRAAIHLAIQNLKGGPKT
jgi:4-hydroxythreonine-4-phosphate dehydrogenase